MHTSENENTVGTKLTTDEHDVVNAELQELSLDELEAVAGGAIYQGTWD